MPNVIFEAEDGAFEAMRDEFIDPMLRHVGEVAVQAARRRAPVSNRTGEKHLRDTISFEVQVHKLRLKADAEYAADVEVGNRDYPARGGGTVEIPARPYLRPTIYDDLKAWFR